MSELFLSFGQQHPFLALVLALLIFGLVSGLVVPVIRFALRGVITGVVFLTFAILAVSAFLTMFT